MSNWSRNIVTTLLIAVVWVCLRPLPAMSYDLKVCIGEIPALTVPVEGQEDTPLPILELIEAIGALYTAGTFEYEVFPFARSIHNVVTGQCDCHFPLISDYTLDLPYTFTSRRIGATPFVIYSHKEQPITRSMIDAAINDSPFPYKIEADRAHVMYFPFTIAGSSAPYESLMKINFGRIDAYIGSQRAINDKVLELGLENDLHRALYKLFDVRFVIPKGEKGKMIDLLLTPIIDKMSVTGQLQRLTRKIEPSKTLVEPLAKPQD